jgi:hypothetical protein
VANYPLPGNSIEFRDALLLHEPCLLGTLLGKSNASKNSDDELARLLVDLCVLLLSRPLPESAVLPAHAQSFFLRVVTNATANPTVDTLKKVYLLLDGPCGHLLGILPEKSRRELERVLEEIVISNTREATPMLILWCFGIVLLAEGREEVGQTPSSQPNSGQPSKTTIASEREWKTKPARHLFGSPSRVNRAISLIYLAVNNASKDDSGISCTDAIDGIRVAVRAIRIVDQATREEWPKKTEYNTQVFAKLPAKLTQHMNPLLRLQAMCFYAMVAGEGNLIPEVVILYEDSLMDITSLVHTENLDETLALSLPLFLVSREKLFVWMY